MDIKGSYTLITKLNKNYKITIGKLGTFLFPKGFYVYSGSALNDLNSRINRHYSSKKKFHWHIDYLLKHAKVIDTVIIPTERRLECYLHNIVQNLLEAKILIAKFGSADCKCKSHLVYFKKLNVKALKAKIQSNINNLTLKK